MVELSGRVLCAARWPTTFASRSISLGLRVIGYSLLGMMSPRLPRIGIDIGIVAPVVRRLAVGSRPVVTRHESAIVTVIAIHPNRPAARGGRGRTAIRSIVAGCPAVAGLEIQEEDEDGEQASGDK